MITVRGHAQSKDGRIHTDTKDKVATCLLYLNGAWDEGGGRLRVLRSGHDLEDYIAEVSRQAEALSSHSRSRIIHGTVTNRSSGSAATS